MITTGQKIEAARIAANMPIYIACNALGLATEREYYKVIGNRRTISIMQQIMFISAIEYDRDAVRIIVS